MMPWLALPTTLTAFKYAATATLSAAVAPLPPRSSTQCCSAVPLTNVPLLKTAGAPEAERISWPHGALAICGRKTIGCAAVPLAVSVPSRYSEQPAANSITTPASIVSVRPAERTDQSPSEASQSRAPAGMYVLRETITGDCASVQCVFAVRCRRLSPESRSLRLATKGPTESATAPRDRRMKTSQTLRRAALPSSQRLCPSS